MRDDVFEQLVGEAIDSLPSEFRDKLDNVVVTIEDEPSLEQRTKLHLRPWTNLLGLYEWVSLQGRASTYAPILPDKITIFKLPILAISKEPDDIKRQVRSTVLHEIAHHFGFSDEEIRKITRR
jgi:predicted Zn-dependent protease with MMP-like domain